ncbi:DNA double-strand break repair nuclease NurA [Candidatus Woesearchaeota archaeon]|nr:DNA double-strand break repair nuclease NurA [Candidatus Woesearchaeota archaeon]
MGKGIIADLLEDISVLSKKDKSKKFQPSDVNPNDFIVAPSREQESVIELESEDVKIDTFFELTDMKKIFAIDSTSNTLGRVEKGIVASVRGALISVQPNLEPSIEIVGPEIIKITFDNKTSMYRELRKKYFFSTDSVKSPEVFKMPDRIRNIIERVVQFRLVKNNPKSIFLFDGSLITGTVDSPNSVMKEMKEQAEKNNSVMVAVSKHTIVTDNKGNDLTQKLELNNKPCYIDVTNKVNLANQSRYLGKIFVVRFKPSGYAFRVDVFPKDSDVNKIFGIIAKYCGPDGYPDPLRLAHIFCVFDPSEILAMQAYAIDKYALTIEQRIRPVLFGPWSKG